MTWPTKYPYADDILSGKLSEDYSKLGAGRNELDGWARKLKEMIAFQPMQRDDMYYVLCAYENNNATKTAASANASAFTVGPPTSESASFAITHNLGGSYYDLMVLTTVLEPADTSKHLYTVVHTHNVADEGVKTEIQMIDMAAAGLELYAGAADVAVSIMVLA